MEKVLVSACLLGVNCKYNGGNNYSEKIMEYLKGKEVIPICPEQLGGLPTPRIPAERRLDKVVNKEGIDVSDNFRNGAVEVVELSKKLNVRKAILKSRSPSCGVGKIYDGTFSNNLIDGNGVCAELLIRNGIEVINSDDIINC